jgi:hypothetical protein
MPRVIRQKNARLIEKITRYIKTEGEAKRKFEVIVNRNELFAEKMEKIVLL